MKRKAKYGIIVLLTAISAVALAIAVIEYTKTIPGTVKVVPAYGIEVYEIDGVTNCTSIDFGNMTRGASKIYDIIVKNSGEGNFTSLYLDTNLSPSIGTVTWNYTGVPLRVSESLPIQLTLTINATSPFVTQDFEIYINGET